MTPATFTSIINSYLPEPHSSLLNGIMFGVPIKASKIFYLQLQKVSLLHLVVLSGMNITILGYIVGSLTQHFPKKANLFITLLCIICFTLFVGPQPPIVRAAVMGSLSYLAIWSGRKNTALISLLIATIFIFILKPGWIAGVSFQLSFGATLGLIVFNKPQNKTTSSLLKNLLTSIKNDLLASLSAQVFTVPLIFLYFGQISFISPLANLLVSPLIAPLMIFGFITVVSGSIWYVLGLPTAYICYGLLQYMVIIIELLSKVPYAFFEFK